jgi:hypothetical protein
MADVLKVKSGGKRPAARSLLSMASTPTSPTSRLRIPCEVARRASATHASTGLEATGDACCGLGHLRLPARVPGASGTEKEAHIDIVLVPEPRHLLEFIIREEHYPGAL